MTDTSFLQPNTAKNGTGFRFLKRQLGFSFVVLTLFVTFAAFAVLMGYTPIAPNPEVTWWIIVAIAALMSGLLLLVIWEIYKLVRARRGGKIASRLHIRIVSLFAGIAAVPAILVAIIASVTLDRGLDRWFSERTQAIVGSSVTVARAYLNEHARFLLADVSAIATDYARLDNLLIGNKEQLSLFMNTQARLRNIPHLQIIDGNANVLAAANMPTPRAWPKAPEKALKDVVNSLDQVPIFINPGRTKDLVGALLRIDVFEDRFLYAIRLVDPKVVEYLRVAESNSAEYSNLSTTRTGTQVAFALLYMGVALVLLISSVWVAINFADGLVSPIRQLMTAASAVSKGDLSVQVPVRKREGDLGSLSETFNEMTTQLSDQRRDILEVNAQLDHRRRFIETVLAGVSAGVVGMSADGTIEVINRSAQTLIARDEKDAIGQKLVDVIPEIEKLWVDAVENQISEHHLQISLSRKGRERTVNARITAEFSGGVCDGFVLTLDDITELVTAQRTSAWADVARRIAHEIKNPLTPIQLSAERLRRRFGKDLSARDQQVFNKCTSTIVRQVGDIGRMVDEFSSFARMPKPVFLKGNMANCLKEAVEVREVAEPKIDFSLSLPDHPMMAYFDERLLSQAFTNLVKNAGEAILCTEDEPDTHSGRVHIRVSQTDAYFVIEVIDTGKGWPKENRHKLLEPYTTTRKKGTGLGLAIVAKVIEEHQGRISLLDAPDYDKTGRGAMVRITLPSLAIAANETDNYPSPLSKQDRAHQSPDEIMEVST